MINKEQALLFIRALKLDAYIIMKDIISSMIDIMIWVGLSVFANGYILPMLGITKVFGSLIAIGAIVSHAAFQTYGTAISLVGDFTGDRTINYSLMLPMPSWMVFLKIAFSWSLKAMTLASVILPLSKLILLERLNLSNFSPFAFALTFISIAILSGAGGIFSSSIPDNMFNIDRVWVRYVFPLWFLGGSIFPFTAIIQAFPKIGWILIINPFVHATEAIRASVLGSTAHYLPLCVTLPSILIFSATVFAIGFVRLRRKLDFI